jgi:hypothetical protein
MKDEQAHAKFVEVKGKVLENIRKIQKLNTREELISL